MIERALTKTNPYMDNPAKRRLMFQMTVFTSTGIEGVTLTSSDLRAASKPARRLTSSRELVKSSGSRR